MRWRHVIASTLAICFTLSAYSLGRLEGYAERGGATVMKNLRGDPIFAQRTCPGASVTVLDGSSGSTNATLYSDSSLTPKVNPFTADPSTGFWSFFTNSSTVRVQFDGCGMTWTRTYTVLTTSGGPGVSVLDLGAVPDVLTSSTASMPSGSASFTISEAVLTATMVGKRICVSGSGVGGAPTCGTITTFNSTTNVTLSFTNASGGAISSKFAYWGTDSTAAFVAAEAALTTTGTDYRVPSGSYMIRKGQLTFNVTATRVHGDGNSSVIYAGDNTDDPLITAASNGGIYSDFKIVDGNIDWTHTGQSIKLQSPGNDTILERLWLRSGYDLIYSNQLDNIKILHSTFEDSRRYAIYLRHGSTSQIRGNSFYA